MATETEGQAEARRARWRRYYHRGREREALRKRRDRARRGDELRARDRERKRRDRDSVRRHTRLRQERLRSADRTDPPSEEWEAVLLRDPCAYCGERSEVLDHVQPLSRGGSGNVDNLIGSCDGCNRRKHAKPLLAFLLAGRPDEGGRR